VLARPLSSLVTGGFINDTAERNILKFAAANGAARVIAGQGALLFTPAASHLIRIRGTDGGSILSASHNPDAVDEDFGIQFNMPNGGPAPKSITQAMYDLTTKIDHYLKSDAHDVGLGSIGAYFDAGTTPLYLSARYYDPQLGMCLQPDWWAVTEPGVGTNKFSFKDPVILGNPIGFASVKDETAKIKGDKNGLKNSLSKAEAPAGKALKLCCERALCWGNASKTAA
jgi:hypothetical protein